MQVVSELELKPGQRIYDLGQRVADLERRLALLENAAYNADLIAYNSSAQKVHCEACGAEGPNNVGCCGYWPHCKCGHQAWRFERFVVISR